ncbi:hypothetical protein HN832_04755 [archaeon]|jgi:hypothetical protein|nr:hypothetical protein [archaeon]MBT4373999.1 hypothetical protein [archaeon]MBT4532095.1 hypothetical protein [archaeon]MBT7001985.1 hypothetical protein [archaeon]MBT7282696.1 hypothetical protein [archaeon]
MGEKLSLISRLDELLFESTESEIVKKLSSGIEQGMSFEDIRRKLSKQEWDLLSKGGIDSLFLVDYLVKNGVWKYTLEGYSLSPNYK